MRQGSQKTRGSPGMHPRGPSCRASRHLSQVQLDVVAPPLHVFQKSGEGGPADDVSAALRALAVTNRGNAGQVGGYLNATAVVRAERGLSPNSLRQVDH